MLSHFYTLISDPCTRTVDAFMTYARTHPGSLLTLSPADVRAMRRAIASTGAHRRHSETDDVVLILGPRAVN